MPPLTLILGLPESGIRDEAERAAKSGGFFGAPGELLLGHDGAPTLERQDLTRLHRRALGAFQLHFASTAPLPPFWQSLPPAGGLLADLKAILSSLASHPNAVIQSPVPALLLPLYEQALQELEIAPRFVLCVRNPEFYVDAPLRWEAGADALTIPPLGEVGLGVWLRHTLSVLGAAPDVEIVLHPDAPTDLSALPLLVGETYSLCRQIAGGERPMEEIARLAQEFGQWLAMLAPPGIPGTRVGLGWYEHGAAQVSQTPFLPSGDWQTVRTPVSAPAATDVFGLLYGQPCRVWIRRCVWHSADGIEPAELKAGPGSEIRLESGCLRLDGAFEQNQIRLRTPLSRGPYALEIEMLLEAGPSITLEATRRLTERLQNCRQVVRQAKAQAGEAR